MLFRGIFAADQPLALALALTTTFACGGDDKPAEPEVTTEHCEYVDVPDNANATGNVEAAPLFAGASEAILDVPVTTALGAYTSRAGFLGTAGKVDLRKPALSGSFNASIGVESAPMVKVLSLRTGEERVVIVKLDLGLVYEGMIFDLEERLGAEYRGKVIITASHSHSAWGQQTGSFVFQVGLGPFRQGIYERYLDQLEAAANAAIAAETSAKLGIFADDNFDPEDRITRDRRSENDELAGGRTKDSRFFMVRVDAADNTPIAALPIYGVHGTLMGADNSFASTEASGAAERYLEEMFDEKVVVMHLQGAGGDVSPAGRGDYNCDNKPGDEDDPCFDWLRIEGHGRTAAPVLFSAWEAAGANMQSELAMEMLTRSIELGPKAETFTVRDGALSYLEFSAEREADREIFAADGSIISPIDEFNAPVGASLCEADVNNPSTAYPLFPDGLMPGTDLLAPYGACVRVDSAASILGELLDLQTEEVDATHPVCQSTRTTISALRLGDHIFATVPGELTTGLAAQLRGRSPVAADKTILLGYAQGHTGYCLTAEDWLQGGYEPSINVWGPLEAEYIGERLSEVMELANTPTRDNASRAEDTRVATLSVADEVPHDVDAPMAGTVPAAVPDKVWLRTGADAQAQPSATIPRVSGLAKFVWIGDDPQTQTPVVTIERQVGKTFEPLTRRSGRLVRSADLLLMYTPQPLRREGNEPQTHYWAVEWQAVPWQGAVVDKEALDSIENPAALPLGNYRFRVTGKDFEITSEVFEVTPAEYTVAASQAENLLSGTVTMHAPKGYRLLTMSGDSNEPLPVRAGIFQATVQVEQGPDLVFDKVSLSETGEFSVDVGNATAVSITVVDERGNGGSLSL